MVEISTFCCSDTTSSKQSFRNSRFFSSRGPTLRSSLAKSLPSAIVLGCIVCRRAVARGELCTLMGISSKTSFQEMAASLIFSPVRAPSLYTYEKVTPQKPLDAWQTHAAVGLREKNFPLLSVKTYRKSCFTSALHSSGRFHTRMCAEGVQQDH